MAITSSVRCRIAASPSGLPDFRNLGVILRILLLAEVVKSLFLLVSTANISVAFMDFMETGAVFEPVLLSSVLVLMVLSGWLQNISYQAGQLLVVGLAVFIAIIWNALGSPSGGESIRHALDAAILSSAILWYFDWRHRALSPALSEARLMALQARIRPHFLFNSLNTVLGLIRSEPRRAERVLENLAELYRALLSEAGTLVSLTRELELARGYAEIETMRLGERLKVSWQCQDSALDALVPPLILQPLLENAVYHGVEPSESGGDVNVAIFLKGGLLNMVMRNPCVSATQRQGGNRMALENIRERLALHFDAEAEMSTYKAGGEFVVQIRIPYRHG